jgi:hypothetical protein
MDPVAGGRGKLTTLVSFLHDRIVQPRFSIQARAVLRCNGSTSFRALLVCPQFTVRLAHQDVIDAARLERIRGEGFGIGTLYRLSLEGSKILESVS